MPPMADITVPRTGIVNPPVIITDLAAAAGALDPAALPAVAILTVDDQLVVGGTEDGTPLPRWLEQHAAKIIPAIRIGTAAQAEAVGALLRDTGRADAFVVAAAERAELVQQVRRAAPLVRGAVEFGEVPLGPQARARARRIACDNWATVVVFPDGTTADDIDHFSARMVTVWAHAAGAGGVVRAVAAGYPGVITSAPVAHRVYQSFDSPTLSGRPIVLAHRGFTEAELPENTLLAFRHARTDGRADVIETDLHLSADGDIVLIHDHTLDRTVAGQSGPVNERRTAELVTMTSYGPGGSDTVPTLAGVLDFFADDDVVVLCEIKEATPAMVAALNQLLADRAAHDRVIAFVGAGAGLTGLFTPETIPGVAFALGGIGPLLSADDEQEALRGVLELTAPLNHQPLPYTYPVAQDWHFYHRLAARGLLSWTSTKFSAEELDEYTVTRFGAVAGLANDPRWSVDQVHGVEVTDLSAAVGESLPTAWPTRTIGGAGPVSQCRVLVLEGTAVNVVDGVPVATTPGQAVIAFVAEVTLPRPYGDLRYQVVSAPVTVTVR